MKIDLNCDLGEAFGNYTFGGDQHILPLITSANIACGYHAGDEDVMNETVQLAKKNNISIVIGRWIGIFLSWVCVHWFMNIYDSSDYFKPLTTDIFALFLGAIHFIVIMLIYLVIYGFSHRNN